MHPLLPMLRDIVLPWLGNGMRNPFLVARPEMAMSDLPPGVALSPRQMKGRRVIVRGRRKHANERLHMADWPDDNLQELTVPKLACVVEGTADYLIENYCLHCPAGTFLLIPPGMPHHDDGPFLDETRLPDASCTLLFAHVQRQNVFVWFSRSQGKTHKNNRTNNFLFSQLEAGTLFKFAVEEAASMRKDWEHICRDLLHSFFLLLIREVEAGNYMHPGPAKTSASTAYPPRSFQGELTAYIETNFNRSIKLEDVAANLYLSKAQFCRRVREETGNTFIELLTRYRIERARELLRETDWTASAIASHVGFQSTSYFQNVFRSRVGMTPVEYRHRK